MKSGAGEPKAGESGAGESKARKAEAWKIYFSWQAQKDAKKLSVVGLRPKAESLLEVIAADPYAKTPRYELLVGNLQGLVSRRINIQHRLVYRVHENARSILVLRMWSHYE